MGDTAEGGGSQSGQRKGLPALPSPESASRSGLLVCAFDAGSPAPHGGLREDSPGHHSALGLDVPRLRRPLNVQVKEHRIMASTPMAGQLNVVMLHRRERAVTGTSRY